MKCILRLLDAVWSHDLFIPLWLISGVVARRQWSHNLLVLTLVPGFNPLLEWSYKNPLVIRLKFSELILKLRLNDETCSSNIMWREYVGPFSKILHFSHVWSVHKTSSSNVFVTHKYSIVQPIANQALKGAGALRSHKNVTMLWTRSLMYVWSHFFSSFDPFPAPPHYVYVTNMMLHENIWSLAEA